MFGLRWFALLGRFGSIATHLVKSASDQGVSTNMTLGVVAENAQTLSIGGAEMRTLVIIIHSGGGRLLTIAVPWVSRLWLYHPTNLSTFDQIVGGNSAPHT